ncbi:MAG: alanine:cation symporter family protein [Paludibacteraceae bacterium]|nr:alanine:cation symporter family protein [Paludibacteraceae bacterium]
MSSFYSSFASLVSSIYDAVWGMPLVVLLLMTGLYFTIGLRFVQIRYIPEMLSLLFRSQNRHKGGRTSFQSFAMALSGRVGTGNIVGVATAIAFGGPGAIVWMWILAFFGAGTAFAESTLAQIYKEKDGGEFRGGPAYFIEKGLKSRLFGIIFAFIAFLSMGFFMPPIQTNSIASSLLPTFGIPLWVSGLVVAGILAAIIIGGVKRIAKFAAYVTPLMALIYILVSLIVLAIHIDVLPTVFVDMIKSAFGLNPVLGAILGKTVIWGVKRGLYSNEAGQGTGAMSSAAAGVSHPVEQGLVQAFSVYIDTLLVCSATALMILACKTYNIIDTVEYIPGGRSVVTYFVQNPGAPSGEPGVLYTSYAVGSLTGLTVANIIISIALFFFAFTTILAYYYYAETSLVFLFTRFAKRHNREMKARMQRFLINLLRCCNITMVFIGSVLGSGVAWTLGDIGVGSMAWINVFAILLLSPKLFRTFKDYEHQRKLGKKPVFSPDRLNIKNTDCWKDE